MAGANRIHWPRRGSLQFWPRVRARAQHPKIKNWAKVDASKLLGFIGFKAGMTHIIFRDNASTSVTKGMEVSMPVTVIECPPLFAHSYRLYKNTPYGSKLVYDSSSKKLKMPDNFDYVHLLAKTNPKSTLIGKKKPNLLEIAIGGKKEEQIKKAQSSVGKEIKISDVFKDGQFIDVHAVSKGKGFQGTVKRFGVKIRQHKSEKTKRGIGTLGPWRPRHVSWRVPQSGKMGYHARTEHNKLLVKINSKPNEINPKGGFVRYGLVKNDYILVKGSVPGPVKREVILTDPTRQIRKDIVPEITYISLESKQ
ncbi:MAG: 50S ribosomal protein L3 [Nanoarchaeota archaeon]